MKGQPLAFPPEGRVPLGLVIGEITSESFQPQVGAEVAFQPLSDDQEVQLWHDGHPVAAGQIGGDLPHSAEMLITRVYQRAEPEEPQRIFVFTGLAPVIDSVALVVGAKIAIGSLEEPITLEVVRANAVIARGIYFQVASAQHFIEVTEACEPIA